MTDDDAARAVPLASNSNAIALARDAQPFCVTGTFDLDPGRVAFAAHGNRPAVVHDGFCLAVSHLRRVHGESRGAQGIEREWPRNHKLTSEEHGRDLHVVLLCPIDDTNQASVTFEV